MKGRKSEGCLINAAMAHKCVMQYLATEEGWGLQTASIDITWKLYTVPPRASESESLF